MKPRFTIDGSDALENHLAQTCERVAMEVRQIIPKNRLEALLLGGGYGRGHGGVFKSDDGDKPYNDLEFYLCLRGNVLLNQQTYQRAIHEMSERLTPEAGVEVELKISSLQKLNQNPPTMFSYDLAWGHQTLIGDAEPLVEQTIRHAGNIPLSEATRLMMNRCTGLLFSKERLLRKQFTSEDADFVGRNHAKAQLGFGDVFLTAYGQYHWDCRERNHRLANFSPKYHLPWLDEVRRHHNAGVEFKLHPKPTTASMNHLCDRQRELTHLGSKVWLWLESTRLNQMFTTPRDYALSPIDKCPETNPIRNYLINARTFGPAGLLASSPWRYPRERLFHALALLLWEPQAFSNANLRKCIPMQLRSDRATFTDLVLAYETLWKNFN